MKRFLLLTIVLLLASFLYVLSFKVSRAENTTCASGPIGTTFDFTFTGFRPNHWVNVYLVEPDGTARIPFSRTTAVKSEGNGTVHFSQPTDFGNFALALGTWQIVATEPGLGGTIAHQVESCFTVGGQEGSGVTGASLVADPPIVYKPDQGYLHMRSYIPIPGSPPLQDGTINVLNTTTVNISGSGFTPFEVVSFWVEQPNGECSSMTVHQDYLTTLHQPPFWTAVADQVLNTPYENGLSTFAIGNAKADAAGNVLLPMYVSVDACDGSWRIVGRGNASGLGGETWITVSGNEVPETASLIPSSDSVNALFGRIAFSGSGYAANEVVSCWLTTPQGASLGFPHDSEFTGHFVLDIFYQSDNHITASAGGTFGFEMVTGSVYDKYSEQGVFLGAFYQNRFEVEAPVQSEGGLGWWAMSCRGNESGSIGIARFRVDGSEATP